MATEVYIESAKKPGIEFIVTEYDKETKTAILQGMYAPFPITPFTKDHLAKNGWVLKTREKG